MQFRARIFDEGPPILFRRDAVPLFRRFSEKLWASVGFMAHLLRTRRQCYCALRRVGRTSRGCRSEASYLLGLLTFVRCGRYSLTPIRESLYDFHNEIVLGLGICIWRMMGQKVDSEFSNCDWIDGRLSGLFNVCVFMVLWDVVKWFV